MRDETDELNIFEDVVKEATFILVDEASGKKQKITIRQNAYGLSIKPQRYGGGYAPIAIDFFSGSEERKKDPLRVFVWSDPEEEEATHIISLDLMKNKEEDNEPVQEQDKKRDEGF